METTASLSISITPFYS